jgi:hypothetical protein
MKVEISTSTVTTFGTLPGSGSWFGGCVGIDGKIYFVPYNATQIAELDPSDDSITLWGDFPAGGSKWLTGTVAGDGKIYCLPGSATSILVIDTVNKTTEQIGNFPAGQKWSGSVLAPDGSLIGIPNNHAPTDPEKIGARFIKISGIPKTISSTFTDQPSNLADLKTSIYNNVQNKY